MSKSVAFVTGSSSGIGRATAIRLSREFSAVVLAARNAAELAEVADQVRANGAEPLATDLDLIAPTAAETVVGQTLAKYTHGIKIDGADRKELTEKFSTMPPHPEVPAALRKLRDAGFRLFTLTDNLLEVQTPQLEHGGIVDLFERRFSADGVKRHKSSRQAYASVERELGVEPCQLCRIACHTWDTVGAVAAGWEAALIKRAGNDVLGVGPQPQIVGDDLNDVADKLVASTPGNDPPVIALGVLHRATAPPQRSHTCFTVECSN
jgi:2-haloalkanoic acid dehalogenase type II